MMVVLNEASIQKSDMCLIYDHLYISLTAEIIMKILLIF